MQNILLGNQTTIVAALSVILIFNLILTFSLMLSNSRLKRKFKKWKAIHATADLESVYEKTLNEVEALKKQVEDHRSVVEGLRGAVNNKISTARVMRYNAFSELGSDLSFSIALLDDNHNGVVISSIYGRQESRTYAKPIVNGQSQYALTEEEDDVLSAAVGTGTVRVKAHA